MTTNGKPRIQGINTSARIKAELEHNYRFKPGDTFKDYTVIETLGFGGFAEVYHCQDYLEREVAIKVLIESKTNLKDEAIATARLDHPNIVFVIGYERLEDDTPIIIYKYIKGRTLEEILNESHLRRLTLDTTNFPIIEQVGAALQYAHQNNVIHRDIKPSNIIIDDKGKAYLTDFGLASIKKGPDGLSMISADVRQAISGTMPYMAPEQLLEKTEGNEQSDIYSFGVVVYEMLTGQLPFQGRDAHLIINIANEDLAPISPNMVNPELPFQLEEVLFKALKHHPEERYQTVSEFLNYLANVTAENAQINTRYQEAMALIEQRLWRKAQDLLTTLPPTLKDVELRLEQAEQKVRLDDLYNKSRGQIKAQNFEAALETLNMLKQIDPDYNIDILHQQAELGLKAQNKNWLQEKYAEAIEQFKNQAYQAALDCLDEIAEKEPNFPDVEGIRKQAQKEVDYQRKLHDLYEQGVSHSRQESWGEALDAFTELIKMEPEYEDVSVLLPTAQHFLELSNMLAQAKLHEEAGDHAFALDTLADIQQVNGNYKPDEIKNQRHRIKQALYDTCQALIEAEDYAASLNCLQQLKERDAEFLGLLDLEQLAQNGLARQKRLAELEALYTQAESKLKKRDYFGTLTLWQQIEKHKGDLPFVYRRKIGAEAKEGLYGNATAAIADKNPTFALELWEQLRRFDPKFKDHNDIVKKANKQIQQTKVQRRLMIGVGGGIVVLLLFFFSSQGFLGAFNSPTETPTVAATAVPTNPPTKTATATSTATATTAPTQTATATHTATPNPTRTATARPTKTPQPDTAVALDTATIFSQRDETSPDLAFIATGETVILLEQVGRWILVRNSDGIEGWAAANRFELDIHSATATPSPTATVPPTNTPGSTVATVRLSVTLFSSPNENATNLGFADPDEIVTVLGRSENGSWLFVRRSDELEGWVSINRMTYAGDVDALPIIPNSGGSSNNLSPPNAPPSGNNGGQTIMFDFWHFDDEFTCTETSWIRPLFMQGHGGNGVYNYYIDGEKVAGPMSGSYMYQFDRSSHGNNNVMGSVISGDGLMEQITLFVPSPDCG